jgi:hypothetical protein
MTWKSKQETKLSVVYRDFTQLLMYALENGKTLEKAVSAIPEGLKMWNKT